MIYYREHRGSFEDSMKTLLKFEKVNELMTKFPNVEKIEYYAYDDRLKAETFIVVSDMGPMGFMWIMAS